MTGLWPRRRDTLADAVLNDVTATCALAGLLAYGAWLLGAGVWGAVVERRLMTRRLP